MFNVSHKYHQTEAKHQQNEKKKNATFLNFQFVSVPFSYFRTRRRVVGNFFTIASEHHYEFEIAIDFLRCLRFDGFQTTL